MLFIGSMSMNDPRISECIGPHESEIQMGGELATVLASRGQGDESAVRTRADWAVALCRLNVSDGEIHQR